MLSSWKLENNYQLNLLYQLGFIQIHYKYFFFRQMGEIKYHAVSKIEATLPSTRL